MKYIAVIGSFRFYRDYIRGQMAIERPTKIRDTIAVFPDKTYIFVPDLEHTQGIEFSDIVHLVDYHIVPFREREQIYARIRKYQ